MSFYFLLLYMVHIWMIYPVNLQLSKRIDNLRRPTLTSARKAKLGADAEGAGEAGLQD